MTIEEKWQKHYAEIMAYMETYKRQPSKHRIEDHLLLNWIKYNKKRMAAGKLSNSHKNYVRASTTIGSKIS